MVQKAELGAAMGKEFRASLAIQIQDLQMPSGNICQRKMAEVDVMERIRIHELAKKLGKENKEILNYLTEKGHSGKKPYEFIRRGTGGYGRR